MDLKQRSLIIFLLFVLLLLSGCAATSNYYTAKTLKPKQKVITPSWNNMVNFNPNSHDNHWTLGLIPGCGIFTGLPWRFETGVNYIFPSILDFIGRWQINPESFTLFDACTNFHFGTLIVPVSDGAITWTKYGIILSKQFNRYQPFFSISKFTVGFFSQETLELKNSELNSPTILSFGYAYLDRHNGQITPEIGYVFDYHENLNFWTFGVGIRVPLKHKTRSENND
ncbi:hypothetical protein JW960_19245 [candidate division KSB1 bacterium]|nr:hypothetical protein [candidate division KSB1 bacterium]